jgi:hypothetical protein
MRTINPSINIAVVPSIIALSISFFLHPLLSLPFHHDLFVCPILPVPFVSVLDTEDSAQPSVNAVTSLSTQTVHT